MILGIDTANEALSLALWCRKTDVYTSTSLFPMRNVAERITHEVELLLACSQATLDDLTGIVTTIGPGGFSGVRVGLGYAHGVAIGRDIPLYGISVHEALARGVKTRVGAASYGRIGVVQHAGRGMVYAQSFAADTYIALNELHETTLTHVVAQWSAYHDLCVTGNATNDAAALLPAEPVVSYDQQVDAMVLAHLWDYVSQHPAQYTAEAVYVRPPDAALPQKRNPLL